MLKTNKGNFYEIERSDIEKFYKNSDSKNKFIADHPDQIDEFYFCDENGKLKWVIADIHSTLDNNEQNWLSIIDMESFEKIHEGFRTDANVFTKYYDEEHDFKSLIENFEINDEVYLNLNYKYNKMLKTKLI